VNQQYVGEIAEAMDTRRSFACIRIFDLAGAIREKMKRARIIESNPEERNINYGTE